METLAALIARDGKLTPQEIAGWVLRLAQRVGRQHQQGLAHGNVSGYTLLLEGRSPFGKGILVDSPRQTEAPFYSPERAASGQLSQGDDTWALVVLLFYGLTGQYPFQVNSAIDIARAVALGPPKIVRFGFNDHALQGIFDQAFSRDLNRRLASIDGLIQAIHQWIRDPSLIDIEPLEDDDEDAPTMMMQNVSIGSPLQLSAPQAPLPAPRPAAGAPSQLSRQLAPPLPPIPAPPLTPSLPDPTGGVINPRQSPTLLAIRPEEEVVASSPFSKGALAAIWLAWAVVTFGGAAVEYAVLSR